MVIRHPKINQVDTNAYRLRAILLTFNA